MLRLDPVWSDGNVALSLITKIASDRAFLCINRQMVASLRECRCRDSAVEQPLLHLRYRKFGVDAAFAARSARVHRARCNGCKIEVDVLTQYVDRTATIAVAGVAVQSRGDHFGICSTSVFASAAHGRALAIVRSDHDVHDKFRAGSRILSLAETYCPDGSRGADNRLSRNLSQCHAVQGGLECEESDISLAYVRRDILGRHLIAVDMAFRFFSINFGSRRHVKQARSYRYLVAYPATVAVRGRDDMQRVDECPRTQAAIARNEYDILIDIGLDDLLSAPNPEEAGLTGLLRDQRRDVLFEDG